MSPLKLSLLSGITMAKRCSIIRIPFSIVPVQENFKVLKLWAQIKILERAVHFLYGFPDHQCIAVLCWCFSLSQPYCHFSFMHGCGVLMYQLYSRLSQLLILLIVHGESFTFFVDYFATVKVFGGFLHVYTMKAYKSW